MSNTDWHILLLCLACVAFFVAAIVPFTTRSGAVHPLHPWRLRIVAAGLLLYALTATLLAASVI